MNEPIVVSRMQSAIPREVADVLGKFCQSKRSGSVVLEIKEGHVQQIKATTTTAVVKKDKIQ